MRPGVYKATGVVLTAAMRLLGIRTRVTGLERIPDRPVLFVVNHFTRFETFLVPYVIYHRFRQSVNSLAAHFLFKGALGRYFRMVGVLSTRDPHRNRTIIGDLMTGRANWVIYPEGGLVKNKKMVEKGRLMLSRAGHSAPPHTGGAVMALKSELRKARYLAVCAAGDAQRRAYFEDRYGMSGPEDVCPEGTVIVPLTITYTRLRSGNNLVQRVARLLTRTLDPGLDEELAVEGSILFGDSEISVHVGDPIEVRDYLGRTRGLVRRLVGRFRAPGEKDVFLRRPAKRLTGASMRSLYGNIEINLDHLFCYGLRSVRSDAVPVRRFHTALYMAAMELRQRDDVRLHPVLRNGVGGLANGEAFEALDSVERLAFSEGVVRRSNGTYVIDRAALDEEHDFHDIRLKKMVQVIANELEPVAAAVNAVRRAVNLDDDELERRLPQVICASDLAVYHRAYDRWHEPGVSKPRDFGEPFFLEAKRPRGGVVLAHGYLASPEQVRPLAEHLYAAGYSVYGVRLAGHGTAPRHLAEVTWRRWLETLDHAHAAVRHCSPRTFVGGFSLGGVLAALLAARRQDEVDGLFLLNAPLRLRNPWMSLVPTVARIHTTLRRLRISRARWSFPNDSESPEFNYDVYDLASVRELRGAMRACRAGLDRIVAPTLVVQADGDPVVARSSAELFRRGLRSAPVTVHRVPDDRHLIVRGQGSPALFDRLTVFLDGLAEDESPTPTPRRPRPDHREKAGTAAPLSHVTE